MPFSATHESRLGFVPVAIHRFGATARRHLIDPATFGRCFGPIASAEVMDAQGLECLTPPSDAALTLVYVLPSSPGGVIIYASDGSRQILLPGGLLSRGSPSGPLGAGPIERDMPYRLIVLSFLESQSGHVAMEAIGRLGSIDPNLVPCVVSSGASVRVIAGGGTYCRSVLPDSLGLLVLDVRLAPRSSALIPLQDGYTRLLAIRVEGVVDIESGMSSSQSVSLMECRPCAKSLAFSTAADGARLLIVGTQYEQAAARPGPPSDDSSAEKGRPLRSRVWSRDVDQFISR